MTDITSLSQHFPGLEFFTRNALNGFRVRNDAAEAVIYLQGAQLAEYRRHGEPPLIWLSGQCGYQAGRSLRGGIPVCWPWFGDAARNPETVRACLAGDALPAHGLVRAPCWRLDSVEADDPTLTRIRLSLRDSEATRAHFPYAFELRLLLSIGEQLDIELQVENRDERAFAWSGALHTYFAVSDIGQARIQGLAGSHYVDTLDDWRDCRQQGPVLFQGEVDRIYLGDTLDCQIEDTGWQRRIGVQARGSRSCVVWNPWTEKALRLSDFDPQDYRRMLCVETARALEDSARLAPGQVDCVGVCLSVEPLD